MYDSGVGTQVALGISMAIASRCNLWKQRTHVHLQVNQDQKRIGYLLRKGVMDDKRISLRLYRTTV